MKTADWFRPVFHDLPAGRLWLKPGVRGHPDLPPGASVLQRLELATPGRLLDLSGSAGLAALTAVSQGAGGGQVLEPSAATLGCARRTLTAPGTEVAAGLLAEEAGSEVDTVVLLPAADRGTARVELEIRSAAAALNPAGRLLLVSHKDRGGKRYEKLAAGLFRQADVIRRDAGWRVLDCRDPLEQAEPPSPFVTFRAAGLELRAVKGTFAAGKLDPGTAELLQALGEADWLSAQDVLDLGCGYGLLALQAAAREAAVTALDDDLGAVRSTALNASNLGLENRLRVLHSDLDEELADSDRFDTVLMNPPFHIGKGVRLDLPRAFIDTAFRRLRPGGELWLVANRALPYERLLGGFRTWSEVRDETGFKVLRAVR